MVPWMEQVERESNGRVKFETFTSGSLVEMTKEYDGLMQGLTDIAAPLLPIYDLKRFPTLEVTMLPFTHTDTFIASRAFKKLIESDVEIMDGKSYSQFEFGDKNLVVMALPTTQEYSISLAHKEFHSPSDIPGTTMRTASRIHDAYAKNLGMGTVTVPGVEMFETVSRGAVDGVFFSVADWSSYGLQELFKTTIKGINFGHFNALIAMTKEKWDSLPPDIQEIMRKAAEDQFEAGAQYWVDRAEENMQQNMAAGGKFVELSELDPGVQELLVKGIEDTWYHYIDILNESGIPGEKVVALWRDLVIEEGGTAPEGVMSIQ